MVTGCAGYIGSVLTHWLLRQDYEVFGVDTLMYNNKHVIDKLVRYDRFSFLELDVCNLNKNDFKDIDVVMPLAAIVGAPACDRKPERAYMTNTDAIHTMCHNLSKNQRIIFPNTNSGYGLKGEAVCTEESPLEPTSHYGKTKCAAEKRILEHGNAVSLRLATVCGVSPRMRFDLIVNDFCAKVNYGLPFTLYEPNYKRNFVSVHDVARAFIFMITNNDLTGVYNVGHHNGNMTKLQLLQLVEKLYGIQYKTYKIGEGRDPDQRDYFVSTDKIEKVGFHCMHSIESAILSLESILAMHTNEEIKKMGNV